MTGERNTAAVSESEVWTCLERVLASRHFAARRRGELLRYLVERTLAGEGEQLGEYGIALDVFGKPESFDPRSESTIRAEMSRLRKGLADYYAADGAADPWRFEFPLRGYAAVFARLAPLPPVVGARGPRRFYLAFTAAALLAVLGVAGMIAWRLRGAAVPVRSVVVLPFANLTGDATNDYLTDGLTESLTDSLARVDSLRVVARTSAFQFRNKARDIREIGRAVDADAVVEGSVRRVADHFAVTVQVNRSADGFHILSRVFEAGSEAGREAGSKDLSSVERQIGAPVLAVLRPGFRQREGRAPDSEAWTLLLKARALRGPVTVDAFNRAVGFLNEAIRRDPQYAEAYGELASFYAVAAVNLHLDETAAANMAKSAARKALELDQSTATAWAAEGMVDAMVFLNWREGEAELRKAIAFSPQDALIHNRLANILTLTGKFDEALKEAKVAERLDPLISNPGAAVGLIYFMQRRYDEARRQWAKVLTLHPDAPILHAFIGSAYDALGQYDKAMAEYALCEGPLAPQALPRVILALIHSGRTAEARARLGKYERSAESDPFSLAVVYAALGEKDKAFAALEEAWQHRNCWMLKVYPPLDPLRSDPRYRGFLKRANFE